MNDLDIANIFYYILIFFLLIINKTADTFKWQHIDEAEVRERGRRNNIVSNYY